MKHLLRTAMAALVSMTAAAAVLLPAGAATAAAATPAHSASLTHSASLNSDILIGTWANIKPSQSVQTIVVTSDHAGGILVDAFGACPTRSDMTPCEWGNVRPVVYVQPQIAALGTAGSSFRAEWSWDHGRARSILAINLVRIDGKPALLADEPRIYLHKPKSGPNWISEDIFETTANSVTPTKNGTEIIDSYPRGNSAGAADRLLGTWTNPAPNSQGISKIAVTKGRHGLVTLHAWGACATGLSCDWGTTYGNTFWEVDNSTGVSKQKIAQIAAQFDFGSRHVLFCTELEPDGMLMVTEFYDYVHHGRVDKANASNYTINEDLAVA